MQLTFETRWCSVCNTRERTFVAGRCTACGTDGRPQLRPCTTCGRPCTAKWCSTGCHEADEPGAYLDEGDGVRA